MTADGVDGFIVFFFVDLRDRRGMVYGYFVETLEFANVPGSHAAVVADRSELVDVLGKECEVCDGVVVPHEGLDELAGGEIAEPDFVVLVA